MSEFWMSAFASFVGTLPAMGFLYRLGHKHGRRGVDVD